MQIEELAATAKPTATRVLVLTVRELGPVLKLGASVALIEGGTEVVMRIDYYDLVQSNATRNSQVHWKNGGAGVIKGVATLPDDIHAALAATLKPGGGQK